MKKQVFIYLLPLFLFGMGVNTLKAQTPFSPNTYSGWVSTPTNSFATIPTGSGVLFTQVSRGAGNTFSTAADGFNSSKWNNPSANAAIAANQHLTFSVSSDGATTFEVDSLKLILGRSNAGPDSCILQYKLASAGNNFIAVTAGVHVILNPTSSPTTTLSIVPASPILAAANDTLVFRLVAWHASSTLGTMKLMNNTTVYGKTGAAVVNSISSPLVQTSSAICVSPVRGDSVQVTFNSIGAFNPGNTYSLELSDASGNFVSPLMIGNISSDLNNGTIQGVIPAGTIAGSNYRLRIKSSDPVVEGLDTTQLSINPGITLSATIAQPACPDSTGAITLTTNGGSGLLEYNWSNGEITQNLADLTAGTYTVTVSDGVGCSLDSIFSIQAIPAFAVTESITNATCHSDSTGSIEITLSGATSPYTVSWSGNGISQTGLTADNLPAGTYLMSVLDGNNCPYTNTYLVNEPNAITATDSITAITCNAEANGSIEISVNGGTAPYVISWTGNGINQTGALASNLSAGDYDVIVLDANNCAFNTSYTVTEPAALTSSASITHAACASCNGTIAINASGGVSPYSYLWFNGSTSSTLSAVPGQYCVEVSDINGCELDTCFTISSAAGIEDQENNQLQVFPNPATDAFQLIFPGSLNGIQKVILILNVTGEIVFKETLAPDVEQLTIETASWTRGTYIYRIQTGSSVETGKIQIVQ